MDYSLQCSIHGIFQARVLEWVATSFSRGSSQPRDWNRVSHTAGRLFTIWATRTWEHHRKLLTLRVLWTKKFGNLCSKGSISGILTYRNKCVNCLDNSTYVLDWPKVFPYGKTQTNFWPIHECSFITGTTIHHFIVEETELQRGSGHTAKKAPLCHTHLLLPLSPPRWWTSMVLKSIRLTNEHRCRHLDCWQGVVLDLLMNPKCPSLTSLPTSLTPKNFI